MRSKGTGVGLGQSSTYFRGFPDGDYDIDFDGIPFYDTNTPTHHSWAFFPAQFLGSIDFDRSPGTASTIGPTPFGGSIHLLSKPFNSIQNVRAAFSGGSFHTYLYDGEYDSSQFGPKHKFNVMVDVHHMQSDGYQTFNFQTRNAGDLQFQYKPSEMTSIYGYSGVIWLDANTPNFSATRCQMYGTQSGYTCTGKLAPFAGSGINFLETNNSDPELYLNNQYNYYHVPTDFEYVGIHHEFARGFLFDIKPYTYNYDNSEKYSNAVPITNDPSELGTHYAPLNTTVTALCNTLVKNKLTCGVDKYNSYRKYGETSELSQVSKLGVFRAGLWFEHAATNRHQYPADPLSHWQDAPLPNFAELFDTNSYQPFAEYEFHVTSRLNLTPGVKFAYYTVSTQQFADNGGKIGGLGTNNPASFILNGGEYFATLPSATANYRIHNNWSAYVQFAQGSIVPPSAVFDFTQGPNGTPVATPPQQQKNTTYQGGTVLKFKRVTLDADYYHIHFDNSYSSFTPVSTGEPVYFLQPSSITQGFEAESNLYLVHGLSAYLNASVGRATYSGSQAVSCVTGATGCTAIAPQLSVTAPSGLWVANTPSDIETEALTYQRKAWDVGLFNKRVGRMYQDNGAYHNQAAIDPFSLTNVFFNYTLRTGSRFDNTKLRLSFNNLFDQHSITGYGVTGTGSTVNLAANGTTYTDPFTTSGPTPIAGGDTVSILPGRSIMLSISFGLSPKR